jgi:hypothetical protein
MGTQPVMKKEISSIIRIRNASNRDTSLSRMQSNDNTLGVLDSHEGKFLNH